MKKKFKSIFISDLHIGSYHCKSDVLLEFLKEYEAETIYLVGDIFDFWKLKNKFYLSKNQISVLKKFLKLAKKGIKLKYVIGNHDEILRGYLRYNLEIENIEIANSFIHENLGKKFLVMHGDQFDGMIVPWLYYIGDILYELLLNMNTYLNFFRHRFGFGYWSLSKFLKGKTKEAVAFINDFERVVSEYAEKRKCDGVIFGHTHSSGIKTINDKIIINCGDFVESCTAVLEEYSGKLVLIQYENGSWKEKGEI